MSQEGFRGALKRALDVGVAGSLLLAAAPAAAGAAAAVAASMGRPVVFRQRRPGKNGVPFDIYKFRTMSSERDAHGQLLPDAQRLTRVGAFLRKTSLDELPQLWNVLRGELSLVGPRPLLVQYLDRYSLHQARRHEVKPGITGWAQVNGRNAISWEQKLDLDIWYVDNWSLMLDFKILAMTALKVVKGSDTTPPGHATMPEFMGAASNGEKR